MKHSLIAAALLLATPATAHEWYGQLTGCCSDTHRECYEVPASSVEPGYDEHGNPGWFYLPHDEFFPLRKLRITPAEHGATFHRCSLNGSPADPRAFCLAVPMTGF